MKKILKFSKRKIGTGLFEIGLQVEFYKNEIYNIESTTNDSRAFDGYDGGDRTLALMCLRYNNLDEQEYDLNGLSVCI